MTVFKDISKLSWDYLPEKMIHRTKQMERLHSLFKPVVESNISQNAFLFGSVGTGKTHLSKRFCLEFLKFAQEHGKNLEYVLVNCRQKMKNDAVLLSILRRFDERFPDRGFSIPEKLDSLRKHLEKRRTHLIVILDEADVLLKKSGSDLIYTFSRFGEEAMGLKPMISLILISQKNVLEIMDKASLSTFKRTNVVQFPKYSTGELKDILNIRVDLAFFPGAVQAQSVDLMADISSEYGDARLAIELLENAGRLADEEGQEEVTPEHVRGAREQTHAFLAEERLPELDRSRKLTLLAIARRMKKHTYISTGEAEEAYALVCEEFDEKRRGHTQFWKYLRDLDSLGFIETKISGEGIVGKTTLISLPGVSAEKLAKRVEESLIKP